MPWSDVATKIILIVLCVAVGLIFLFAMLVPYANKFLNPSDIIPGSNPESVDLENAMKCTYYRCVNGCDSDQVKSLTATWSDPQTRSDVSCADFCTPGKTICNADSKNNPVRIDILEKKAYISQDTMNPIFGTDCITSPEYQDLTKFQGINWVDVLQNAVPLEYSIIYGFFSTFSNPVSARFVSITDLSSVDPEQAQYQKLDCYIAMEKIGKNAYSSANIVPGKYQISMEHDNVLNHIFDVIYISPYQKTTSSTTLSSAQATSCIAAGGNCKPECSNAELPLGQMDCSQGGSQGSGKTCCK